MATPAQLYLEPDPDYVPLPELAQTADGLIRRHPRFGDLAQLRIVYLERLGEVAGEGEEAAAKCQKPSPLWRDLANVDLVIWVWRDVWQQLTARQREALTGHELCHAHVTEKGTVKLLKHDLEEFAWVAAQYGAWDPGRQLFARALLEHREPVSDKAPTPIEKSRRITP